ncbi:MAG: alpha-L-fucosidase [Clostridiales bacterium]|jgi:alpha-L-fucosidase|nr:alpha-L-fucosidase [Clostridiales bacterium]
MFDAKTYEKRMEWFNRDRFGMFIHWGLYAIPARGEWVRSKERISLSDYQKYFGAFNPSRFDPAEWAKLAKEAGMKYAVLTAKHHDGFCLFDSKYTDYKSTNTPMGRDIVREYIDAFRAEGIRTGLYYSLLDWRHPDYPHFTDNIHPMRGNPEHKDEDRSFGNYLEYMHNQVKELCTDYGKIDLMWFDFSYDHLTGEAWRASDLMRMVRRLQPDIIIDDRLEYGSALYAPERKTVYSGDYASPEQVIPPNGLRDENGRPAAWEACVTMNNNWGYNSTDNYWKPADMLIRKLVECVSKGGNMLLNVGPDANGAIPEASVQILRDISRWMSKNGESIYGCGPSGMDKPEFGRITKRGNTLYYHVTENTVGPLPLIGIDIQNIKSISFLDSGAEILTASEWYTKQAEGVVMADLGPDPVLPDRADTVVKVELI